MNKMAYIYIPYRQDSKFRHWRSEAEALDNTYFLRVSGEFIWNLNCILDFDTLYCLEVFDFNSIEIIIPKKTGVDNKMNFQNGLLQNL